MPTAYVLLNTEIGSELDVLKMLRQLEGVQEAFNVLGIYDIIARIKADTYDKLTATINHLKANKIHSKLTVIINET